MMWVSWKIGPPPLNVPGARAIVSAYALAFAAVIADASVPRAFVKVGVGTGTQYTVACAFAAVAAMAAASTAPANTLDRMRAIVRAGADPLDECRRSALPVGEVLALHVGQRVDLDAERGQLQPRDLAVDRLRHGMHARDE